MIDPDENKVWKGQIKLDELILRQFKDAYYRDGVLFALSVVAMAIAVLALMRS